MAIPPWTRPDNFSVTAHKRIVDAVNPLLNITPVGNGEVYGSPHGTGISTPGGKPYPVIFYKLLITGATVVGGLYECTVYDPAVKTALDMVAGPVPTSYYAGSGGGSYLGGSGNPTSGSVWYCLNHAESNAAQWTLVSATRGPFMAVNSGRVASDGTKILDLVSEFTPSLCGP